MAEPRRRLDHVVIAVRDLEEATARYRALGFDARPGGRHTRRGTHNAIIRFGLDYLELISVYDEAEARQAGRAELVDYLRGREGLVAYALATDDIAAEAARLAAAGLSADGPFAMERLRPDGSRLSWRLVIPGDTQYRRAWPFFIQWDQSDDQRLARDGRGEHANGARAIARLDVGVDDVERGIHLYEGVLGLPRVGAATFDVAGVSIALVPRVDLDDGPSSLGIHAAGPSRSIAPSAAGGARIQLIAT
ncbi:MAG: VOC family protein [Chloroflexota bacterium]|nr:VOC family protein [Chloroflexota bacterium]